MASWGSDSYQSVRRRIARIRQYREVSSDVLWSSWTNFATVVARTASFLMLGRQLGPAVYGTYVGMYGVINPIGGLTYSGMRLAVLQRAIRDKLDLPLVSRSYLTLAVIQGVVGVVVATAIVALALHGIPVLVIVGFAVVELIFAAIADVSSSLVQAASSFRDGAKIRFATQIIKVGTLSALFYGGWLTLGTLSGALVVTGAAYTAFLLCFRLRWAGASVGFTVPHRRDVQTSSQLSLTLFASSLNTDGDKAILSANGLNHDAGVYGAGYRVFQFALLPAQSIESAVFHRFLRRGRDDPSGQLRQAVRMSVVLAALNGMLAALLIVASASLHLFLGHGFQESETVIRWLAPVAILMALEQGPGNALAGLDRLRIRTIIISASSAFAVTLYLVLIPRFGWQGAAVATYISETTIALSLWVALIVAQRQVWRDLRSKADA